MGRRQFWQSQYSRPISREEGHTPTQPMLGAVTPTAAVGAVVVAAVVVATAAMLALQATVGLAGMVAQAALQRAL